MPGSHLERLWQSKGSLIYTFGAMALFFMLFEGTMSYILPLVVLEHGFSKTLIGIILSIAAISGVFFDFAIYRIFKNAFYRRLFIVMFILAFLYIFMIWISESFILYVIAMAMWGFYYDLRSFGTLDFVTRYSEKKNISSNFGILQVFQSIGLLLAPLVAGFLIFNEVDWEPFAVAFVFLSIAALFFLFILLKARNEKQFIPAHEHSERKSISEELAKWKTIGRLILPVLALAVFSTVLDSFFMAIGPLVAESLPLEPVDGIFMFAYLLPPLLIGGFVGQLVSKFGEKNTALFGLLIGSAILSTILFFGNPFEIILIVFFASCFTCMMSPVIQSFYAHFIHGAPKAKKEIQELGDFSSNFGYVLGPLVAGVIADNFGNMAAFSVLGAIGVIFAALLFVAMPSKIRLKGNGR